MKTLRSIRIVLSAVALVVVGCSTSSFHTNRSPASPDLIIDSADYDRELLSAVAVQEWRKRDALGQLVMAAHLVTLSEQGRLSKLGSTRAIEQTIAFRNSIENDLNTLKDPSKASLPAEYQAFKLLYDITKTGIPSKAGAAVPVLDYGMGLIEGNLRGQEQFRTYDRVAVMNQLWEHAPDLVSRLQKLSYRDPKIREFIDTHVLAGGIKLGDGTGELLGKSSEFAQIFTLLKIKDLAEDNYGNSKKLNLKADRIVAVQTRIFSEIEELRAETHQKELQEQERQRFETRCEGLQSATYLVSTLMSRAGGSPKAAREFGATANGLISAYKGIRQFKDAIAAKDSLTQFASTAILTGNLVSIGMNIVGSFFGSGPDPSQLILEQIRALREEVQEFRKEVKDRFDRVDRSLDQIYGEMVENFQRLEAGQVAIREQLSSIQATFAELLGRLYTLDLQVQQYIGAIRKVLTAPEAEFCKNFNTDFLSSSLDKRDFQKCVSFFKTLALKISNDSIVTNQQMDVALPDLQIAQKLSQPTERNLGYLAQISPRLISQKEADFPNLSGFSGLPNPLEFYTGVSSFMVLGVAYPKYLKGVSSEAYDGQFSKQLDRYRAFFSLISQRSLYLSILKTYEADLGGLQKAMDASLKRLDQAQGLSGLDFQSVLKDQVGLPNVSPSVLPRTMKPCPGAIVTDLAPESNENIRYIGPPITAELDAPADWGGLLPKSVQALAQLNLGHIETCYVGAGWDRRRSTSTLYAQAQDLGNMRSKYFEAGFDKNLSGDPRFKIERAEIMKILKDPGRVQVGAVYEITYIFGVPQIWVEARFIPNDLAQRLGVRGVQKSEPIKIGRWKFVSSRESLYERWGQSLMPKFNERTHEWELIHIKTNRGRTIHNLHLTDQFAKEAWAEIKPESVSAPELAGVDVALLRSFSTDVMGRYRGQLRDELNTPITDVSRAVDRLVLDSTLYAAFVKAGLPRVLLTDGFRASVLGPDALPSRTELSELLMAPKAIGPIQKRLDAVRDTFNQYVKGKDQEYNMPMILNYLVISLRDFQVKFRRGKTEQQ